MMLLSSLSLSPVFFSFAVRLLLLGLARLPHLVVSVSGGAKEFTMIRDLQQKYADFVPRAIVDIGANVGMWSQGVHAIFPAAKMLLLEASPDKDTILRDLVATRLGGDKQQASYNIAVLSAHAHEKVQFFQGGDTGNSMFRENTKFYVNDKPVERSTSTLDAEIDASVAVNMDEVDLIKIDVQGAEIMVLNGGTRALEAATFVQLEAGAIEYNSGGCCFGELDQLMRSYGFFIYDFGQLYRLPRLFLSPGLGQFDILYVKPSSPRLPQRLQQVQFCGQHREPTTTATTTTTTRMTPAIVGTTTTTTNPATETSLTDRTFNTFEVYVEKHTPTPYRRGAVYFLLGVVSTTLCQALLFVIYVRRKNKKRGTVPKKRRTSAATWGGYY